MSNELEMTLEDVTCFRALIKHCRTENQDLELTLDHEKHVATYGVKVYTVSGDDVEFAHGDSISAAIIQYFKNIGKH